MRDQKSFYKIRLKNIGYYKKPYYALAVYLNGKWIATVGSFYTIGVNKRLIINKQLLFFYLFTKKAYTVHAVTKLLSFFF